MKAPGQSCPWSRRRCPCPPCLLHSPGRSGQRGRCQQIAWLLSCLQPGRLLQGIECRWVKHATGWAGCQQQQPETVPHARSGLQAWHGVLVLAHCHQLSTAVPCVHHARRAHRRRRLLARWRSMHPAPAAKLGVQWLTSPTHACAPAPTQPAPAAPGTPPAAARGRGCPGRRTQPRHLQRRGGAQRFSKHVLHGRHMPAQAAHQSMRAAWVEGSKRHTWGQGTGRQSLQSQRSMVLHLAAGYAPPLLWKVHTARLAPRRQLCGTAGLTCEHVRRQLRHSIQHVVLQVPQQRVVVWRARGREGGGGGGTKQPGLG